METQGAKRRRITVEEIDASRGNLQTLQEAMDLGVDRAGGKAALRKACANGLVEVLDRLLAAGLDVEDLRADDNYAVRYACENGHVAVLDRLLAAGLSVEDLRTDDNYAARYACRNGHVEVLGRLLAAGLSVEDLRDGDNKAVRLACTYGHVAVLDRLLAEGLGVEDLRAREGEAIRHACEGGHVAVLDRLSTAGVELQDINRAGASQAVVWTCVNGHDKVIEWLLLRLGRNFPKEWVLTVLLAGERWAAKWRGVLVAMRVRGVLPTGNRAAVIQRRVRTFLTAYRRCP